MVSEIQVCFRLTTFQYIFLKDREMSVIRVGLEKIRVRDNLDRKKLHFISVFIPSSLILLHHQVIINT